MRTENIKYKDSGIPWIGEIPEDWEVRRARDTVSIIRGGSPRPIEDYISGNNEGYNWIKIGDTIKGSKYIVSTKSKIIEEGLNKTRFVHKDDLILTNSMSFGEPYILKIDGCIHDGWVAFSNYKDITKEFLYYLLISPLCRLQFEQQVAGGVVQNLNIDKIGTTQILLPPLPMQQRIADFLDKKCSEIDELAALQETMIAELKRYKQSVITEAVTKGLNKNVKMKDSGVECVGEIPIHWDMILLPFVFYNLDYLREPISAEKRERKNPQYNYYGASGVIDKIDYYNVEDKVLLIGEDGANLRMRNLPLIYKAEGKFWVNNHAHILKPRKDNYDYMYLMLEALDYNDFITGSAQPKLSQENLSKVKVCVPPLAEQQAIADFLDEKCNEIDELIAIKQQKIEQLKEYKKSVIFEYVTGKKEI